LTSAVWLERGSADDASALAALETACFSHPWTVGQFRQELALGAPSAVLVLRSPDPRVVHEHGIVAYCVYRLVVDEMHLMDLAVTPGWRRRGLAGWLLRFSLVRASRDGARRAFLEVRESNHPAQALYAHLGFSLTGRRAGYYREPPETAVVLTLDRLPAADP
jgi:[ribosomal protein S18]-alanine N-acetyltransferase